MAFGRPGVGSREGFIDRRQGVAFPVESREFYFGYIEEATVILIDELRKYFRDNPRTANYRWVGKPLPRGQAETDIKNTKIHISHERPDNPEKFPSVQVSSVSGRMRDLWLNQSGQSFFIENPDYDTVAKAAAEDLGDEYFEPEYLEVGEECSGKVEMTVTLTIRSLTEPERDRISDLVLHGLVGQVRRALYIAALNWMPDQASFGPTQEEPLDERHKIYFRTITFGLQAEWYDDFYFQAVNITDVVLGTITKDGPVEVP